jgi:hypothetical protein
MPASSCSAWPRQNLSLGVVSPTPEPGEDHGGVDCAGQGADGA